MGRLGQFIQYYVEGEDEEKLLSVLKTDMQLIVPGKISKFNAVTKRLTKARLMNLRPNTTVVLVFDTDTESTDILRENIKILNNTPAVYSVIFIPQIRNLEDELVRCCNIKSALELTGSKTVSEYKHQLITATNLSSLLRRHGFDIDKLWVENPDDVFSEFKSGATEIKIVG